MNRRAIACVVFTFGISLSLTNQVENGNLIYKPSMLPERLGTIQRLTRQREKAITRQVAYIYGLSPQQTALLLAIRDHEAGRPGKEFGVEHPHAMRYSDGVHSFIIQAKWAAGTIKRHCPNTRAVTLQQFNHGSANYKGWAEDLHWWWKVRAKMQRYLEEE